MTAFALVAARRQSRGELVATWLDGGAFAVYTAPRPATGGALTTQTKLVEFAFPVLTVSDGAITAEVGAGVAALNLADGTAVWGRVTDRAGAPVGDCDVGDTASDAVAKMDSTAVIAGSISTLTQFILVEG